MWAGQSGEQVELSEAIAQSLAAGGDDLLRSPGRLLGYLSDLLGPDSAELRVLQAHCDAALLEPFLTANHFDAGALRYAEEVASELIIQQYSAHKSFESAAEMIQHFSYAPEIERFIILLYSDICQTI